MSEKNHAHRDYAVALRPHLPKEALRRHPWRMGYALVHVGIVVVACLMVGRASAWWAWPLLGVVVGHSLACLAFVAHEVSHNAVLKRGTVRTPAEQLPWGLNFLPATMWDEVHNVTHHCHTNTPRDPDRKWLPEQANAGEKA